MFAGGGDPSWADVYSLVAAARSADALDHPAVVAAIRWKEWLHPRGKNGRFIEKFSLVNVFADPSAKSTSRDADRRRGRIVKLTPRGAQIEYFDSNGDRIEPDPANGFPEFVNQGDISGKLSLAPKHIARIPDASDADEWALVSKPKTFAEYQDAVKKFNAEKLKGAAGKSHDGETGDKLATSDAEWVEHREYVESALNLAYKSGMSASAYLRDSNGNWSDEAYEVFFRLVDTKLAEVEAAGVPKERRSVILGGLPGAGKTTAINSPLLRGSELGDPKKWATADADQFKEMLASEGLVPQIEGLSDMEATSLIHELSSEMAHMFGQALMANGYNTVIDTTMGVSADDGQPSVVYTASDLREYGYEVGAVFVEAKVAVTQQRKEQRWLAGFNAKREGRGLGGRYTPLKASRMRPDGRSIALENFYMARDRAMFDSWVVVDGSGNDLLIMAQGDRTTTFDSFEASRLPGAGGAGS